jgi:hypothetical protein
LILSSHIHYGSRFVSILAIGLKGLTFVAKSLVTGTRLNVILAFTAALILGIPIWWSTTRVPRAVLPHDDIGTLVSSAKHFETRFPIDLQFFRVNLNCNWQKDSLEEFLNQKLALKYEGLVFDVLLWLFHFFGSSRL